MFDAVGRPVLEFYRAMDKYEALKGGFAQWGAWIIILKGLTPIPLKLVTIMSGVAKFDLVTFALTSLVSRSLRFFLLGALLWRSRRGSLIRGSRDPDTSPRLAAATRYDLEIVVLSQRADHCSAWGIVYQSRSGNRCSARTGR